MTDSATRPPDPNAETPDGQEGGLQEEQRKSKRTGLDEFEDRAKEAARKQARAGLDRIIGEILTSLGDAERDDEQRRRYREFLVRLIDEPLQAIGFAPPPHAGGEHRVMVRFCAEPSSPPYFIGTDFIRAGLLAALLWRLNECRFQFGPAWEAEASQ